MLMRMLILIPYSYFSVSQAEQQARLKTEEQAAALLAEQEGTHAVLEARQALCQHIGSRRSRRVDRPSALHLTVVDSALFRPHPPLFSPLLLCPPVPISTLPTPFFYALAYCSYISPCHTLLYHAVSCHAVSCHAVSCHAAPCHAMLPRAMPCRRMPCHAAPCCACLRRLGYESSRQSSGIPIAPAAPEAARRAAHSGGCT